MTTSVEQLRELQAAGISLNETGRERLKAADQFAEERAERFAAEASAARKVIVAEVREYVKERDDALESLSVSADKVAKARTRAMRVEAAQRTGRKYGIDIEPVDNVATLAARADGYSFRQLRDRVRGIGDLNF